MNTSMISSMVSMKALQQKLDILADNMANLNTTGFKRKDARFEDILMNVKEQPQAFLKEGRLSPPGYNQSYGMKLSQVHLDLTQGALNETGVETDLAFEGPGLFEVAAAGVTAYTRDGGFQLSVDENDKNAVYLTTKEGYYLQWLNADGETEPVRVPKNAKLQVDASGQVTVAVPGQEPAVRQLKLVRAVKPEFLEQIGGNLFVIPQGVDNTQGQIVRNLGAADRTEDGSPLVTVRQGFLEQSNVSMADEMTELLLVQRTYQLNSRAISSSDTMMGLANNLRA